MPACCWPSPAATNGIQTTSGAAYLAERPGYDAQSGPPIDRAVYQAANIEPLLRFPARLGLARVQNGELTAIPPREADAWLAQAQAHADLGTYVPISPLITELAAQTRYQSNPAGTVAKSIADKVRLGAARQHVDAVLIYTAGATRDDKSSPLSLLDLTIVGAYLVPSRSVKGEAQASALLIDVRNGYPYGTANAAANASDFVPSVGSGDRTRQLAEDAEVAVVGKLAAQVDTMLTKLKSDLQTKELEGLRAKAPAPAPRPARAKVARAAL